MGVVVPLRPGPMETVKSVADRVARILLNQYAAGVIAGIDVATVVAAVDAMQPISALHRASLADAVWVRLHDLAVEERLRKWNEGFRY